MAPTNDEIFVKSDLWPRRDGRCDWTVRVPDWDFVQVGVAEGVDAAYDAIDFQLIAYATAQGIKVTGQLKVIRTKFDAIEEDEH